MQMYGSLQTMMNSANVWLLMLLMSLTALLPDILLRALQDNYSPLYRVGCDYEVGIELLIACCCQSPVFSRSL